MPPPLFDVLDDGDGERHPAEVDPISDEDAARINTDFYNPRGSLGQTNAFARHLETLDHGAIAAKMVYGARAVGHKIRSNRADALQAITRYLQTLAQAAVSAQ
ncbi:hypothetical protein BC835DRAFT_1422172 [Cytidiella melzeri]|nr:hypothetical protein BC835DRAFT_1422172 [Cytidiella melzeri]